MLSTDPSATAASVVELLQARAESTPDRLAFSFLIDGEEEGPRLTYADLDRQARAIGASLREAAGPGDRALMLYPPGLDFISAFFGCLYAGIIPVPAYPPRLDRLAQGWEVLGTVAADCTPQVVLTTGQLTNLFGGTATPVPRLAAIRWVCTDGLDPAAAGRFRQPALDLDAAAVFQYTSGSTASPRGVILTHRNLIHNQRAMAAVVGPEGVGQGVCWLPLYHDMGLVGGVLQPLYYGSPCAMMSPLGLLQKPARWLQAISRYRARSSGGPNFAYDLCVDRVTEEEKAGLDLSNWGIAALGGEPVSHRTLERFTAAFASCGFRPEAFLPCYGLAEGTLGVAAGSIAAAPVVGFVSGAALEQGTAVRVDPGSPDARAFVGCGGPRLGQQIAIVRPDAMTVCPERSIGEIWVRGPSVGLGYWGRPEETQRTFRAFLTDTGEGPFLRTGDLGFFDDGELFVTGRLKDLLVVRGRNHYPQDVEQTVQAAHPSLRANCGAAFETTKDGKTVLVVVQEVERGGRGVDPARVLGDVREAVARRHDLHLHDLVLLDFGSIPKTSSGKVQRHRCRAGYEQGTLKRWKGTKREVEGA